MFFIIGTTSCQKDENENTETGLYFSSINEISEIIVKNNEIAGYDSTKHIFRITESAWNRIKGKISPVYPDPHIGFNITLNNEIIYRAQYIPGYYSTAYFNIITFILIEPNLVYIELGYPPSTLYFTGIDYRNDPKIITQLRNENKLIEIEN